MDKTSLNNKRLIDQLICGRDSTKKLQNLLRRKIYDDGSVSADDLVMKILGSFSDGLSLLSSSDSGELCQIPTTAHVGSGDRRMKGHVKDSRKKPAPADKERRGCYKRRKTTDSWIKIAHTIEDGYAWRKYGQKEILNAKFSRCYYRCTHQKTQGCKALRQVQKLDESNTFHIIYFGQHTCQNIAHINARMFSDSGALNSFILNREDVKNHHDPSSCSPSTITNIHIAPLVKQEDDFQAHSDDVSSVNYDNQSSQTLWKDIFKNFEPSHDDASMMGFDHEDSCASNISHGYLDMENFQSVPYLSDIQFDEFVFS